MTYPYISEASQAITKLTRALFLCMYRGADKSLARPTTRCRSTEAIVSLEIDAALSETLGEQALSCATVKTLVAQFKRGDFSTSFLNGRAKDLSASR
jgi:hypothetical protein